MPPPPPDSPTPPFLSAPGSIGGQDTTNPFENGPYCFPDSKVRRFGGRWFALLRFRTVLHYSGYGSNRFALLTCTFFRGFCCWLGLYVVVWWHMRYRFSFYRRPSFAFLFGCCGGRPSFCPSFCCIFFRSPAAAAVHHFGVSSF